MSHYYKLIVLCLCLLLSLACGGSEESSQMALFNASAIAHAGDNQSVEGGDLVALDGSLSSDSDGDSLTYTWTQESGANVILSSYETVNPTFVAPYVNDIVVFELTVSDGKLGSTDTVEIEIVSINSPPVANAGMNQRVNPGDLITVNGSQSSDPEGSDLTYQWTQKSGPEVTISSSTDVSPSFIAPDVGGTIVLGLMVYDGVLYSLEDSISITVLSTNRAPDADAGLDQTVNNGDLVTLDGSSSSDPDGDSLTYSWTQVSGSSVTLSSSTSMNPTFAVPSDADTLVFSLVVNDGKVNSSADSVTVSVLFVNSTPIADAGINQTVNDGDLVTLDGSGSSDSDGDTLTYSWTQVSGTSVTLSSSTSVSPTFTMPSDLEALVFSLVVNDGEIDSVADLVSIYKVGGETEATVVSVSAGYEHSLILKSDGSLWATGDNGYGQLGDGTYDDKISPVKIMSSGVSQISAGDYHSLILKSDGSLWGAGSNAWGQLGGGSFHQNTPVEIISTGVSQISAGGYYSLFVKSDGSLWGTGVNGNGQLGDGTDESKGSPVEIISSGVSQISAGHSHSLVLKTDGSLWATGSNFFGELGDGSSDDKTSHVEIMSSGVSQISAGDYHSLILKTDGSLWGTGSNWSGELGDSVFSGTESPVEIMSSGVSQIAAGLFYSLILKTNGALWGTGVNGYGQLGDGTDESKGSPVEIISSGVSQISAGDYHSLILKLDGSLLATGSNESGELGLGEIVNYNTPVEFFSTDVSQVDAGEAYNAP
ncbi:MAG: hypothetical protein HQL32_06970 [Planctomycetes bacterium]|nr:hypothetical protein [Planctomycetota bacterium]